MKDDDRISLSIARRLFLVVVALVITVGCTILTLEYRAVPKAELTTVGGSVFYVLAAHFLQPLPRVLGKDVVDNVVRPLAKSRAIGRNTIRLFLVTSFVFSIVLPWVWLVVFSPSPAQTRLLAPHLFLMMSQVLFEIWGYRQSVSALVRISIPVGFCAYRLRLLYDWVYASLLVDPKKTSDKVMIALAVSNLCFWCVMFFYVLLLKVCPPYFVPSNESQRSNLAKWNISGEDSSLVNTILLMRSASLV